MMEVTFYGRLADFAGRRLSVPVPPGGCTVGQLRARLAELDPALGAALAGPGISAFVKDEVAPEGRHLGADAAIEFWPPVSGG